MPSALIISAADNVATALEDLPAGARVNVGGQTIAVVERIPRGHKLALRSIPAGCEVIKYGSSIGSATVDIHPGTHVHTHNLASARGRGDLPAPARAVLEGPEQLARVLGVVGAASLKNVAEPRIAEPPDSAADRENEDVS